MVREGKLREFRDAGKLNYRVDEVDKLASGGSKSNVLGSDTSELGVDAIAEIALSPSEATRAIRLEPAGPERQRARQHAGSGSRQRLGTGTSRQRFTRQSISKAAGSALGFGGSSGSSCAWRTAAPRLSGSTDAAASGRQRRSGRAGKRDSRGRHGRDAASTRWTRTPSRG